MVVSEGLPTGPKVVYLYTAHGSLMSLRADLFKENYVPALPNAGELWELTGMCGKPLRVTIITIAYQSGYIPVVGTGIVAYAVQDAAIGSKGFYLPITEFLKRYRRVESASYEQ